MSLKSLRPHEQLELKFGEWFGNGRGRRRTVACSSGTAALHLALETMGLPPGSPVFVPDYTMVAVARAVVLAGLRPAFVGCDLVGRMNLEGLADYLNESPRWGEVAVIVPHHYGMPPMLDQFFGRLKGSINPMVVEDLAEAHGTVPHDRTYAACWSFYRNKIIAGEEGGAVAFASEFKANECRSLRSLGFGAVQDYTHRPRGHNYRLADSLAELILRSMDHYEANLQVRRRSYDRLLYAWGEYNSSTARPKTYYWPLFGIATPSRGEVRPWVFPIQFRTKKDRDERLAKLRRDGIEARPGFVSMTMQSEFQDCGIVVPDAEKGESRHLSGTVLYLPLTPGEVDVDKMIRSLEEPINPPDPIPSSPPHPLVVE